MLHAKAQVAAAEALVLNTAIAAVDQPHCADDAGHQRRSPLSLSSAMLRLQKYRTPSAQRHLNGYARAAGRREYLMLDKHYGCPLHGQTREQLNRIAIVRRLSWCDDG